MSSGLAQAIDLAQPGPFQGWDESILEHEGLINEITDGGELNFPAIIALSAMMGNAATAALWRNSQVNCEPEYGWDVTGGGFGRNYTGAGGRGAIGGANIWW